MRSRDFTRHQAIRHMTRRLKQDRNQHYTDLACACWTDPKAMARFKEQPKSCRAYCCANPRLVDKGDHRLTKQERRCEKLPALLRQD